MTIEKLLSHLGEPTTYTQACYRGEIGATITAAGLIYTIMMFYHAHILKGVIK